MIFSSILCKKKQKKKQFRQKCHLRWFCTHPDPTNYSWGLHPSINFIILRAWKFESPNSSRKSSSSKEQNNSPSMLSSSNRACTPSSILSFLRISRTSFTDRFRSSVWFSGKVGFVSASICVCKHFAQRKKYECQYGNNYIGCLKKGIQ